jgi:tetratricopeptide (TPR) repeat protein
MTLSSYLRVKNPARSTPYLNFNCSTSKQSPKVVTHFMKHVAIAIVLSLLFGCSNSQSSNTIDYSKGICECLDSLNKTSNTDHSFPICFGLSLDRNASALTQELIKKYGNTNKENIAKLTDQLELNVSIELIDSCTTFFRFTDSLKHKQYKKLNKDSLVSLLNDLESTDTTKRNKKYYVYASTLYFQLGAYEKAIQNVEKVLSEDSSDVKALFIKASIDDSKGNYDDAIAGYEKVTNLSHQNAFYIYSALAKRKKNELLK